MELAASKDVHVIKCKLGLPLEGASEGTQMLDLNEGRSPFRNGALQTPLVSPSCALRRNIYPQGFKEASLIVPSAVSLFYLFLKIHTHISVTNIMYKVSDIIQRLYGNM